MSIRTYCDICRDIVPDEMYGIVDIAVVKDGQAKRAQKERFDLCAECALSLMLQIKHHQVVHLRGEAPA
jgi:hypothetical protein